AINHGVENSLLEELIEVLKQFFTLPLGEKLKCSPTDDILEGYGSEVVIQGLQLLAGMIGYFFHSPLRIKSTYNIGHKILRISGKENKVIRKAMARSLGLDENCIDVKKHGRTIARFTLYPHRPCPECVLRTTGHADRATITYILLEKVVGGLHLMKDDQWYKASFIPGALFINLGEIVKVMTNGLFKSVMDRVDTNSVKDRVSVTVFSARKDDKIIEPLSELVSVQKPQLYKKLKMPEHWSNFLTVLSMKG
ncbi:putative 2-oxoglutarate-dependent dioxygenase ANS, partial [Bienertia sinuspersici]